MRTSVVNLTVHGIGPVDRPLDAGEDRTWISVLQFESLLDAVVGRPEVRITFDDGNRSDVETALPRLLQRGLQASFFLLAGRLGEDGRVDAADVRELVRAGMTIGSHGWAHRDWRDLDAAAAREEFDEAPRALAAVVGRAVRTVAVPFGSYDRRVLGRLRRAGAEQVFTSDGGRARAGSWLQNRSSAHNHLDDAWLAGTITGRPPVRAQLRRFAATAVKRTRG